MAPPRSESLHYKNLYRPMSPSYYEACVNHDYDAILGPDTSTWRIELDKTHEECVDLHAKMVGAEFSFEKDRGGEGDEEIDLGSEVKDFSFDAFMDLGHDGPGDGSARMCDGDGETPTRFGDEVDLAAMFNDVVLDFEIGREQNDGGEGAINPSDFFSFSDPGVDGVDKGLARIRDDGATPDGISDENDLAPTGFGNYDPRPAPFAGDLRDLPSPKTKPQVHFGFPLLPEHLTNGRLRTLVPQQSADETVAATQQPAQCGRKHIVVFTGPEARELRLANGIVWRKGARGEWVRE